MKSDLALAFRLADIADAETLIRWSPSGVASSEKADGTPVTEADIAAETAVLEHLTSLRPADGLLGEEIGEHPGSNDRTWIIDGIDSTRSFAAGLKSWGTLIALESRGTIVLGLASSPAQARRWWATRGAGTFTHLTTSPDQVTQLHVSQARDLRPELTATLPTIGEMDPVYQAAIKGLVGGSPPDRTWSHQIRVAEGEIDLCVWAAGDTWDHAAPSILVEEAGGRFSDFQGGRRLDTRTAIYSNGTMHTDVIRALARR